MSKEPKQTDDENSVTIEKLRAFAEGLRELATNCDDVAAKMQEKNMTLFVSTNYQSANRGMVLVHRFVSGSTGIVATAKAAKLLGIDDSEKSTGEAFLDSVRDKLPPQQQAAEPKEKYKRKKP